MGNFLKASYIDVHEAAQSGHINEVRRWVDEGKPVDARDNTQKTPLHHAAQWGQEEVLDFLIECGADVNASDFIEDTPLHLACYFGHANCARILIMVGANVGAKDCYGNTPSQIFDDQVTEPVLDEIRFITREAINGSSVRQNAEPEAPGPASFNQGMAEGVHHHDTTSAEAPTSPCSTYPKQSIADSNPPLPGNGGGLESGPIAAAESLAEAKWAKGALSRVSNAPQTGDAKQHRDTGGEGVHHASARAVDNRNADDAAVVMGARPRPSASSSSGSHGVAGTSALPPRLTLTLPWDDPPDNRRIGSQAERGSADTHVAAAASDGIASALTVGVTGSAAAGLTYPGLRPLSAPVMRPMASTGKLGATSPVLSGRKFEESGVSRDLGSTRSMTHKTGASLEGRLMLYATRPGGKLDVSAAARDGQVSVLKQALTTGEDIDAHDETGLTALMWAARSGRLSTAKYLVAQGASLERKDRKTGFTALHFAAYYCRSSVVRILVLAGADTQARDNSGAIPGAHFQALSYLSYEAFHHRRLIGRFLVGNLNDGMDAKGKTMFPKNSPLEAYDEDNRPQCVRLGSSDNITNSESQDSVEESGHRPSRSGGGTGSRPGRSRSSARLHPGTSERRASADMARKAYATMHTMHSRVGDGPTEPPAVSHGGGGAGVGVRYYLRRGSIRQVAAKTRSLLAGIISSTAQNSGTHGDDRPRAVSNSSPTRPTAGGRAEGTVNFYLRRASLRGGSAFLRSLHSSEAEADVCHAARGVRNGAEENEAIAIKSGSSGATGDGPRDPTAAMARDMAAAVAAFEASGAQDRDARSTANDHASSLDGENIAGNLEAGQWSINMNGNGRERGRSDSRRGEWGPRKDEDIARSAGWGGGGGGGGVRRMSAARLLEGIQDRVKDVAAQLKGERSQSSQHSERGDRSPVCDDAEVESGTRTTPPQGESTPPELGPESKKKSHQQCLPQQHRQSTFTAAKRQVARNVADSTQETGDGDGDGSLDLARPHGLEGTCATGGVPEADADVSEHSVAAAAATTMTPGGLACGLPTKKCDAAGHLDDARHPKAAKEEDASAVGVRNHDVVEGPVLTAKVPHDGMLQAGSSLTDVAADGEPTSFKSERHTAVVAEAIEPTLDIGQTPPDEGKQHREGEGVAEVHRRARDQSNVAIVFPAENGQLHKQPQPSSAGTNIEEATAAEKAAEAARAAKAAEAAAVLTAETITAAASPVGGSRDDDYPVAAPSRPREGANFWTDTFQNERNASFLVEATAERQGETGPATVAEAAEGSAEILPMTTKHAPLRSPSGAVSAGSIEQTRRSEEIGLDLRETGTTDVIADSPLTLTGGKELEDGAGEIGSTLIASGPDDFGKAHSSGRGGERSSGHKPHKHHHKHKHKHKRSHRHRHKSSDGEGRGKNRRRRSRDHGVLGGTATSTMTDLAPLKRISPPSLFSTQRTMEQEIGTVAELGSDDGGGIGGRGGHGDGE